MLLSRKIFSVLSFTLLSACVGHGGNPASTKDSSDQQSGMGQINSLEFSRNDGLPLVSAIAGNARVVSFGEAHHTVGGYHRLMAIGVRQLIENNGFRNVAIETPWKFAENLDSYVKSCDQTSSLFAMQTIFRQFASQELVELFEWIRERNCQQEAIPVSIYGFDVQESHLRLWYEPNRFNFLLPTIKSYYDQTPALQQVVSVSSLNLCGQSSNSDTVILSNDAQLSKCHNALARFGSYINDHESEIIDHLGRKQYNHLRYTLISLWANSAQRPLTGNENQALRGGLRDQGMAKLFAAQFKDRGSQKTVVLGHIGHLSKTSSSFMPWSYEPKNLGAYLTDAYGDSYKAIGLIANRYESHDWHHERNEPYTPSDQSVEGVLANYSTNSMGVVLDFSRSRLFPNQDFNSREIVGLPIAGQLRSNFDGIIYIHDAWKMGLINGVIYQN